MPYVVLDWQKIYTAVLEKEFFFIFGVSILFTLVTKCPQKTFKLKKRKKWDLAKLGNSF